MLPLFHKMVKQHVNSMLSSISLKIFIKCRFNIAATQFLNILWLLSKTYDVTIIASSRGKCPKIPYLDGLVTNSYECNILFNSTLHLVYV